MISCPRIRNVSFRLAKYRIWPIVLIICAALLTLISCSVLLQSGAERWTPNWTVGSHAYGTKQRVQNACYPSDGVCTPLPLCSAGTVRIDMTTGQAVAGHDDLVCAKMYDVCCVPDTLLVQQFLDRYAERAQQLAHERAYAAGEVSPIRAPKVSKLVIRAGQEL